MYEGRVAKVPGEGSFVFSKLTEADQGIYQCHAYNDNGTAVSEKIKLEHTCMSFTLSLKLGCYFRDKSIRTFTSRDC